MRLFLALWMMLCVQPLLARPVTPLPDAGIAQNLPTQSLTIVSGRKTHRFKVMMAKTAAEQEVGMMWQLKVAPNAGMLFPFPKPRPAAFWMRNTLVPLDLIFVRKDGRIANIAAQARPQSLDPIASAEPVVAVLEIAGGRAAELGIKPGDVVKWK
jgi:uncharacterized protein